MSLLDERMREPLHHGPMEGATAVGSVGNPACGDIVVIRLHVQDGTIRDAAFHSTGSAYQLATASVLCDLAIGRSVDDARTTDTAGILARLPDLPANKHHLARLAVDALQRALDDQGRHGSSEARPPAVHRPMADAEARRFVLSLLANGRQWGTREIEAMARADKVVLPGPTVKFLCDLRRQGVLAGEMDVAAHSWRWWRGGP